MVYSNGIIGNWIYRNFTVHWIYQKSERFLVCELPRYCSIEYCRENRIQLNATISNQFFLSISHKNIKNSEAFWCFLRVYDNDSAMLWRTCFGKNDICKRQPHKMVKLIQTIRRLLPTNYLSVLDHFVRLALRSCQYFLAVRGVYTNLLTSHRFSIHYLWSKLL